MKNFLEILDKEYLPIDLFTFKWRFTDPKYNVLPKDKLLKITPLRKEFALKIYEYLKPFLKDFQLDDNGFYEVQELSHAHTSAITRQWLSERIFNENTKIIVSWDQETCVVVQAEVFCEYWDDFCYEGSDDVTMIPLCGDWVMCYSHGDDFQFGRNFEPVRRDEN